MAGQPRFYNPERIGTLFYPDVAAIADEAAQAGLPPASGDREKIHLLAIDMQVDFCHEQGTLHIPGALEDVRRLIEFIYHHAERITDITCTLDSHVGYQIFHPSWWEDAKGEHPPPLTLISYDDVKAGKWRPLFEQEWSVRYVKQLEEQAKKTLTIWPYHVPIGGVGHMLDPELWSAVFWHSIARKSQPRWWTKGSVPKTEHYSAVQPEITVPDDAAGGRSEEFLNLLYSRDYVIVAGEAESHCVLETLEDLVTDFMDKPEMLERLYVLRDCMSPVPHPEIDFHALATDAFKRYEQQGVHFINSTDPLPF